MGYLSSLMPGRRDLPSLLQAVLKISEEAQRCWEGRSLLLGMREDRSLEPPGRRGRRSCWQDLVSSGRGVSTHFFEFAKPGSKGFLLLLVEIQKLGLIRVL